ncbi:response regulator [Desulfovibrio litoralis]|uniref:Two component transcriptional regulator, winged helix family n=1 Tax=Desulfovibrio litoralis DSM 11393 TaxID=1121455 RepID=A0A1M7SP69_9BACT|nr:response regulator [Desulfovibrio litoralis]SHN60224.1 two component transcriptional regulator, winged helix family [Desulfovibrio litoralis DSM 11393]
MQTILIIEDTEDIRELLSFNLKQENYKVLEASSGEEGLDLAQKHNPNLIILDVMLPGIDGFSVCKRLQAKQQTKNIPIVMLTARGEEIDRIIGFELGAIDYVVKPFSTRELVLRIRSILTHYHKSTDKTKLSTGNISLFTDSHEVHINNNPIHLTLTEFSLLQDLLLHKGLVRSREQLLNSAWSDSFDGYSRTIDAHIKRLREKLLEESELIETVRGVGYRIKDV